MNITKRPGCALRIQEAKIQGEMLLDGQRIAAEVQAGLAERQQHLRQRIGRRVMRDLINMLLGKRAIAVYLGKQACKIQVLGIHGHPLFFSAFAGKFSIQKKQQARTRN
jgi:predicted PurR-regulated permease PerM